VGLSCQVIRRVGRVSDGPAPATVHRQIDPMRIKCVIQLFTVKYECVSDQYTRNLYRNRRKSRLKFIIGQQSLYFTEYELATLEICSIAKSPQWMCVKKAVSQYAR
jgi:hypothetical protein